MLQQFDAFNLNASPAPSHHSSASQPKALDAFADFDDFALEKPAAARLTTQSNAHGNKLNDSFFNAFNDHFNDNNLDTLKAKPNSEPIKTKSQVAAFDAFAATTTTTTKDSKLFDAFNDNFEDSFSSNKLTNSTTLDNNFAKFDAFDSHNFSSDFGKSLDDSNANKSKHNGSAAAAAKKSKEALGGKATDKFAADYSKPESFDADLEEALKRSMLDN